MSWNHWLSKIAHWPDWTADVLYGVATLAVVATGAWILTRLSTLTIQRFFKLITNNMTSHQRAAQRAGTLSAILSSLAQWSIWFLGITLGLSHVGVNIAPILASAGVIGLAVGFGAQSLVKDIISGFFILLEDQYGVGDFIETNKLTGNVEHMNLRVTQLRDAQGQLISIPNGQITTVTNGSKDWARAIIDWPVPVSANYETVVLLLQKAMETINQDQHNDLLDTGELLGIEKIQDNTALYRLQWKTLPGKHIPVGRAFRLIAQKLFYGPEGPYTAPVIAPPAIREENS
jgi:moderate conductance mechanosensitive channel